MGLGGIAGKALFWGTTATTGIDAYRTQREKGRGMAGSLAVSALTAYAWNAFQWPLIGLQLAPLGTVASQYATAKTSALQGRATPGSAFGFADSAAAQTSRARGMLAINESQLNARSYLGSEAGLFAARYR